MAKVVVFVANGTEGSEALVPVDILKRAGNEVDIVSVTEDKQIFTTSGFYFTADKTIDEVEDFNEYDMVFLPGGMPGVDNVYSEDRVKQILLDFETQGKNISAICAAPAILGRLGILQNKTAIAAPAYIDELEGATISIDDPVTYGNTTTSSGLGHVIKFALQLVNILNGQDVRDEIIEKIGFERF